MATLQLTINFPNETPRTFSHTILTLTDNASGDPVKYESLLHGLEKLQSESNVVLTEYIDSQKKSNADSSEATGNGEKATSQNDEDDGIDDEEEDDDDDEDNKDEVPPNKKPKKE